MRLDDAVVILTGASAGIGAATAGALARAGANVVLSARRAERLDALRASLAHWPGERLVVPGDMREPAAAEALVAAALERFGRLSVIINNAALGHVSTLETLPIDDMRTLYETNVQAVLALTQAALPALRAGGGQIVNVSSIVSQRPLPRGAFYAGTKAMVNYLSRGLRMELRGSGIVVTTVYPGYTQSEFHLATLGGQRPPGRYRGVPAERVARAIVHAIEREKQEVYVTWLDWAFTHANRLFPRVLDRLLPPIIDWVRR